MKRIAILDPKPEQTRALELLLMKMGHSAKTAHTALEGKALVGTEFDMVIYNTVFSGRPGAPRPREFHGYMLGTGEFDAEQVEPDLLGQFDEYVDKFDLVDRVVEYLSQTS